MPIVETVRTQITETIRPREINELPLNGRNYLDLALLIPGVSPTNTGSNQRFAETSAVPGQGISIAGQRNLYNSFVVDGVSANDDAADLTGTYYSEEVIDQFQVVTSGGIAEFGRASGGVVNILTQVRHERLAWQLVRVLAQPAFRRSQSARADERSADAGAVWLHARRSIAARPHVLLHQLRTDASKLFRGFDDRARRRQLDQQSPARG